MSQNLKADDLNLLVSLSCPNPQWEHVKFSFEDSPEEVAKYWALDKEDYYRYFEYHTSRGLTTNMLILKAELNTNNQALSTIRYRYVMENLEDSEQLQDYWRYMIGYLGRSMVERLTPDLILDYNISAPFSWGAKDMTIKLRNLKDDENPILVCKQVPQDLPSDLEQEYLNRQIPLIVQDYLKDNIKKDEP